MIWLIVISGMILVGAFVFLFRPSAERKPGLEISDADAQLLQGAVRTRMADRLAGWTIEQGPTGILELIATESATERRIVLDLNQLAERWLPLHASGENEEADGLIEDFVDAVTGQSESDESEGETWIRTALSVRLHKPASVPKAAITRPAGPLVAALVMRNVSGRPEHVVRDELESWGVTEDDAFAIALENLTGEAEDSLMMEPVGEDAVLVAPGDPLATSYALVPGLAQLLRKRFDGKDPHLFFGETGLVAIAGEGEPEGVGALLIEGPQPVDVVVWKR